MAFSIPADIAILVLVEETLGQEPSDETRDVPLEYRLQVRKEIQVIIDAGGVVEVPSI